jgi:hypothetical protein
MTSTLWTAGADPIGREDRLVLAGVVAKWVVCRGPRSVDEGAVGCFLEDVVGGLGGG